MKLGKKTIALLIIIIVYLFVWFGGFVYPLFRLLGYGSKTSVDFFGMWVPLEYWISVGLVILILMIGIGSCLIYFYGKKR